MISGKPRSGEAPDWRADPNTESAEEHRAQIVEAARTCLQRVDQDELRMGMVAREAGYSRATLYRYFSSKEEVLLTIAQENYQRISEDVDAEIREIEDPRMKLAVGIARTMAIGNSADVTHRFIAEMFSRSTMSDSLMAVVAERIGPFYRLAQERGWLRKGVSEEDAVNWIALGSTGLMQVGWPVIGGRELSPDEQVAYIARYLFFPIFQMEDLLD